jgi:hypothetical protein
MPKENAAGKRRREKNEAKEAKAQADQVAAVVAVVVDPVMVEGEAEVVVSEREKQRKLYHERLDAKERENEMYARGEGRRSPPAPPQVVGTLGSMVLLP